MINRIRNFVLLTIGLLILHPVKSQIDVTNAPIPGEIIVRFRSEVKAENFIKNHNQNRQSVATLRIKKAVGNRFNIYLLQFDPVSQQADQLLAKLRIDSEVHSAQFNYKVYPRQTPNDVRYDDQWDMEIIEAPKVWDITTGGITARGDTIVVAVLDSGFDPNHEDIIPNTWINHSEIPNDSVDNDNNGLIDDYSGWNFSNASPELNFDDHGLSVAGIIGAKGNNSIGVTGLNWDVKVMLLSIGGVDEIIEAYQYVIDQRERYQNSNGAEGAFVVATNASFGQSQKFCSDQPVWGGMYDEMGAFGILTGAATANSSWDVDMVGDMPTTCTSDFILTVLNTNREDKRHQGSAYGLVSIDMGAPGDESYTIRPFNRYGLFGGNSAAAPHLTGAIALIYSLPCPEFAELAFTQPAQTALSVRELLLNGVHPIEDLADKTATGGRLDLFQSMNLLQEACGSGTGDMEIVSIYPNPTQGSLFVKYETPDFEIYDFQIYNVLGQLVYRDNVQPPRFAQKKKWIDVSHLPSGTYFMILRNQDNLASHKFVKH